MPQRWTRLVKLNLPLSAKARAVRKRQIDAAPSRRSSGVRVAESSLDDAPETLADQTRLNLNADQWKAFLEALDAPPRELPRLSRLFQEPSVLERGDPE